MAEVTGSFLGSPSGFSVRRERVWKGLVADGGEVGAWAFGANGAIGAVKALCFDAAGLEVGFVWDYGGGNGRIGI